MSTPLRSHGKKSVYWFLLGGMVLGLGGFGIGNFGGGARSIGAVGGSEVSVTRFMLELQSEMRAISAQIGQPVTTQMARDLGLDKAVQARLLQGAALDEQARIFNISVGDAEVRRQILATRAFQGPSGKFDREVYKAALRQQGMTEAQFEAQLRAEQARVIVQGAVVGGVEAQPALISAYAQFLGQTRSFSWVEMPALTEALPAPSETDLEVVYKAHPEAFTTPETRKISYVWLTPDMIAEKVTLDEAALRAAYEARAAEFNQPERRLVERLVYPTMAEAEAAKASGKSFEALAEARGLTLADTDLGEVTKEDLGQAGEAVFTAAEPSIVGPVETDLGPALFSMNAVLEARVTSFEEAQEELAGEARMERARRQIADLSAGFEDDLAGGVTLEELAEATDLEFATLDLTAETQDGIAGYEAFRKAAMAVSAEDFPELGQLDDGGVFALRLDALEAPKLRPLQEARADVEALWRKEAEAKALLAKGAALAATAGPLAGGKPVAKLARGGFVEGLSGEVVAQLFEMKAGEAQALEAEGKVYVVKLEAIHAPEAEAAKELSADLGEQLGQSVAQDLFDYYARAAEAEAGVTIDSAALTAALAQMQ